MRGVPRWYVERTFARSGDTGTRRRAGAGRCVIEVPFREDLVEYKVNFLAPARREKLVARGEVVSAGRRLFVCRAEVAAVENGEERTCADLLQTVSLSPVRDQPTGTEEER